MNPPAVDWSSVAFLDWIIADIEGLLRQNIRQRWSSGVSPTAPAGYTRHVYRPWLRKCIREQLGALRAARRHRARLLFAEETGS